MTGVEQRGGDNPSHLITDITKKGEANLTKPKSWGEIREVEIEEGRAMIFVRVNEQGFLDFSHQNDIPRSKQNIEVLIERLQEAGIETDSRKCLFYDERNDQLCHLAPQGTVLGTTLIDAIRHEIGNPSKYDNVIDLLKAYSTQARISRRGQNFSRQPNWCIR